MYVPLALFIHGLKKQTNIYLFDDLSYHMEYKFIRDEAIIAFSTVFPAAKNLFWYRVNF